jgi:hypothetical protein
VHPEPKRIATLTATAFSGAQNFTLEADRLLVVENVAGVRFQGNRQDLKSLADSIGPILSGLRHGPDLNAHLFQKATGVQRLPPATEKISNTAGLDAQFTEGEKPGSYIVSDLFYCEYTDSERQFKSPQTELLGLI